MLNSPNRSTDSALQAEKVKLCLVGIESMSDLAEDTPSDSVSVIARLSWTFFDRMVDSPQLPIGCDALCCAWSLDEQPRFDRLCRLAREAKIPVIALCDAPGDIVPALLMGADEAVPLPFDLEWLDARIAVFRRWTNPPQATESTPIREADTSYQLVFGSLKMDLVARTLHINDEPIELTYKEFELLRFMMERPGKCCSRDDILDHVWDIDFHTGTNMVEVYMFYLRRKLREHHASDLIQTVRGAGYRLSLPQNGGITP
ncbi:MAG: response regulator transcription factor [Rhodothermales bacterium]|nr:response regulator transcription factor [Rhodothermales bacterium]